MSNEADTSTITYELKHTARFLLSVYQSQEDYKLKYSVLQDMHNAPDQQQPYPNKR